MFERFTKAARDVVVAAQHEASMLRQGHVGTEHLLLGILGVDAGPSERALHALGITSDEVRSDIQRMHEPGLGEHDADALRSIGIDLDEVRRRVEESFGEGALGVPAGGPRRRDSPRGHVPITPRAKRVLELSLREAMALGHRHIGPEHVLLGIVREGRGLAVRIMAQHGVRQAGVRAAVLAELARERPRHSA